MTKRVANTSKTNSPVVAALLTHPVPGVRVRGRTALEGRPWDDPLVQADRALVPGASPVRDVLEAQYPEGYWMHRGLGISPHYRATVWQLLFLAQLGTGPIAAAERAAAIVHRENCDAAGALHVRQGVEGRSLALTGAVLWALGLLGLADAPAWQPTWDWVAGQLQVTALLPAPALVWAVRAAALWGCAERLGGAAALADRLATVGSEGLRHALTFPLTDRPDVLAWMQALTELGYADAIPAARMASLAQRRLADGFWPLEAVPRRLWFDPGPVGAANPWVTLRALAVLGA